MTVYGIRNCNTVKSAVEWLRNNKTEFEFHDYKAKGIEESKLKDWCSQVGWERLVNKRGTTWKTLNEREQMKVKDEKSAILLMLSKTSVIKRPLVERQGKVIAIGFDEKSYTELFQR
jgi:arsenate reductase (glutaredoxin)